VQGTFCFLKAIVRDERVADWHIFADNEPAWKLMAPSGIRPAQLPNRRSQTADPSTAFLAIELRETSLRMTISILIHPT
jgi:hypothetical protein